MVRAARRPCSRSRALGPMEFMVAEDSAERQFEPGHQPPAAPPPAPPRREARNELKPPAAFRITARRTQLRRPRPGAIGDLDPDDAVPGPDRDRDRLPRSTRAAVPDRITEDLADQQDRVISAWMPGPSTSETNARAARARSARPASVTLSRTAALPSPHPPFPGRPAPGNWPGSGRTQGHARSAPPRTSSRTRAASADPGPWLVRRRGPRPWPSVQSRRSPAPLPGPDSRPPCVRGHRNMTVYSATR